MGQAPTDIRREIEATRDRMGDTIQAIAYRLNPKAKAAEALERSGGMMRDAAQTAYEAAQGVMRRAQGQRSGAVVSGLANVIRETLRRMTEERKRTHRAFAS
jgi:hypothetical protein